jgi:predicted TIM-barrel fold metal-dependent hydrolase
LSQTGAAYAGKMARHYEEMGVSVDGLTAQQQLEAMDHEGIDIMVLYPTRGLGATAIEHMDGRLSSALCRAYNRWLADFCATAPERFVGVAVVALHEPDLAAREATYAVEELGARGIMIRPNPYVGRNLHDPAYDDFYSQIERLDVPLATHEACGTTMPSYGDRFASEHISWHIMCHPMEQMGALVSYTVGGVLERHPALRVVILEAGATWLPYWLYRMDEHVEWLKDVETPYLSLLPSEYFKRQGWITIEADEPNLQSVIASVGIDRLLWASDYPHPDATFPGVVEKFTESDLNEQQKRAIAQDNPIVVYGLKEPHALTTKS